MRRRVVLDDGGGFVLEESEGLDAMKRHKWNEVGTEPFERFLFEQIVAAQKKGKSR
jgi:hypothetical protein